ncbi:DUF202 domain-containing protein [Streptococcus saliviloxodontae]|uniref:Sulfite exporter TauE/SafE n=1 Tax=Streptococcus saliviloxodontae TaxID=1349416 RepID=A0ABS2PMM8_9STRE|nr:DUF202 domain-containing protein [Streptococcus saliviloxodontae]MBM7636542.1 sulfite exporter TauE/SafE [Streptococcus saliviloxodontae]
MTKAEMIQGYETEIAYQKHMIDNLGRWFSLLFVLASLGVVLTYLYYQKNLVAEIVGILLVVLGILGMLLFGYGIYKGRQNLAKVIDDFDQKVKQITTDS